MQQLLDRKDDSRVATAAQRIEAAMTAASPNANFGTNFEASYRDAMQTGIVMTCWLVRGIHV